MTSKLIDLKLEELTLLEEDEDYQDDDIIKHNRRAEALREAALFEAKKFFKDKQAQFAPPPEPTEQERIKMREEQILAVKEMASRVSHNLRPFEFSVGQDKFKMAHSSENRELVKDFVSNPEKHFLDPYVDEQGQFKSPDMEVQYYENGLWFKESSREKMLEVIKKQAFDAGVLSVSKDRRNITLDSSVQSNPSKQASSLDTWKSIRQRG